MNSKLDKVFVVLNLESLKEVTRIKAENLQEAQEISEKRGYYLDDYMLESLRDYYRSINF